MKNFLNFRTLFCVLVLTGLVALSAHAQGPRLKVEFSLKDGNKTVLSKPINISVSYTKPAKRTAEDLAADAEVYRPFYIVLSYEGLDLELLRAFAQTKGSIDAEVVITDSYGRLATRKMAIKGLVLEGLNEQNGGEYSNSYVNLTCDVVYVNGIKLPD